MARTNKKCNYNKVLLSLVLGIQIFTYLLLIVNCKEVTNDGIFTYSLSNNPYECLFTGAHLKEFKNENGWIRGSDIKSTYVVNEENRFNYDIPYYHQLSDVHPFLYNMFVHTLSSFFIGSASLSIALSINFLFVLFIDFVLYKISLNYNIDFVGMVLFSVLQIWMLNEMIYPRSYVMLMYTTLLYLYLNMRLISKVKWDRRDLIYMFFSILIGELTHYYFYIFATGVSLIMLCIMVKRKENYKVLNYVLVGLFSFFIGLIIYPWTLKHIIFNPQGKHSELYQWNMRSLKEGIAFYSRNIYNNNLWIYIVALVFLIIVAKKMEKDLEQSGTDTQLDKSILCLIIGTIAFYTLIVGTLEGFSTKYMPPIILPMLIINVYFISKYVSSIIQGSELLKSIVAIIIIAIVLNPFTLIKNIKERLEYEKNYEQFHDIAEKYSKNDCIYIANGESTTINNMYFEIGEYCEVKPVWVSDLEREGLNKNILYGRSCKGGPIIVYAPEDYLIQDECLKKLSTHLGYSIYIWEYK